MALDEKPSTASLAPQVRRFMTGNELVAEAAQAIDFHFMGYYPITPSTEIAERIDTKRAKGEIRTVLLAADGEHGAAGACFGAAAAGARVLNATSANGFLYSLEQLPVQAGSRLPMVLNLVTRSVSGPLDIRCDHSDLMFALQTGWIILLAANPQAVYDLNIIAVKLGEDPRVRLPVMVVSDGFLTSHQRQPVQVFERAKDVQDFLGPVPTRPHVVDPRAPITLGPYMNDRDLINNKYQLHEAHEQARVVYDEVVAEFARLSGRHHPQVESHGFGEATEVGLFFLNSAAELARDVVERAEHLGRVGLIRPNLLRPFPTAEIQRLTHGLKSLVIGERSDTPGSEGGPVSHEVRSAVLADQHCGLKTLIRVYGLGGRALGEGDIERMITEAQDITAPGFAFVGTEPGDVGGEGANALGTASTTISPDRLPSAPPLDRAALNLELVRLTQTSDGSRVAATVADPALLTQRPKRIAQGHGACPGCGIFSGLDQFFKGLSGDVVALYHTGCAMVVTTDYPFSAHRISYIHNLFQNGAPTLAGVLEAFAERQRRGEIPDGDDLTFVMITGDGGMDIGLGPTLGTAFRNHRMIILEYDNQGYMNTGGQLSYATPLGKQTSTSRAGKTFHHRDTPALMAAAGVPYVFTAIESVGVDLVGKAAKAQWYAKNHGLAFGKILVTCPLNWKSEERKGTEILQLAADCKFFPIYEVEHGITSLTYDPDVEGRARPVSDWLGSMGTTRHLLDAANAETRQTLEAEIERRWLRLKARSEHPLL
jgi:pyruvate ferredoxin oxidoreductase alpha subunit